MPEDALVWSIAGVVARHLDSAGGFEVTFWRSLFNALALGCALGVMRGRRLWRSLLSAGWALWFSGVCWSVMFTAFMLAITLTSVGNVLVTMAIGPPMHDASARGTLPTPIAMPIKCPCPH